MSEQKEVSVGTEALKDLTSAVKTLAETQALGKKTPLHQVKVVTPWDPTGVRKQPAKRLKAPAVFQNGARLNPIMLSNEEMDLINQLKPGRYAKRRIEVVRRRDKSIDIRYPNRTIEQRLELKGVARNLTELLKVILIEQEAAEKRRKAGEIDDEDE
jgi:hypothetical protein